MDLLPSKNKHKYFKGNLHGHSNHSDGALNPQEVVKKYKEIGYDFTCLSDHLWKDSKFAAETVLETKHLNQKDFITIPSAAGIAHEAIGLGDFSISTKHILQFPAIDNFS